MHVSFDTYLPWFILREIPFIGNAAYKRLIHQLGSALNVLNATKNQLESIDKISPSMIQGILNHKNYQDQAKKELELVLNNHYKILILTDSDYPLLLGNIPDPPPILTYLGSLDNLSPCISIIGSRNATRYGLSTAQDLSARLAKKGFQIVSGMARGIDSMAHKGALKVNKRTIAVLGSGLNKIYPKENKQLFHDIAQTGTIYSEFRINTDPVPSNFPIRNRIIAGLSCGTLVVEAAKRSGSLITARLAGEYNREVFAVPGSIASSKSQGTHSLLKQGAKLVEDEMDIIDELGQFIHAQNVKITLDKKNNGQPSEYKTCKTITDHIIHFLEPYPVHIDVLIEKSAMTSSKVASQLLELELSGQATRHQGNYYSISEDNHCQNR
ncbi:MAG: DNA-processing protein DprA [Pseudomonadota bacterium]